MDQERRQADKEKAVLIALQHDMALIRRNLEVHGMTKDGSTILISKSREYETLWADAFVALKQKFKDR